MSPIRSLLIPPLLAASLLCLAPSPAVAQKRNIGGPADYYLREKLVGRFARDPELTAEKLTLVLANGGVFLSGNVSTCNLRLRAVSTASATWGVINVTDLMIVQRNDLSDEALRTALLDVLGARTESLLLEDLVVTVDESVATLVGTTPNFYARIKAEESAGTVFGVTEIVNRLRPRDLPSGTDDETIAEAVVSYLGDMTQYSYSAKIEVEVEDGVVKLSGGGRLYMALRQASIMAGLVTGVKRVDSTMRVDPSIGIIQPLVTRASR
jgi:osmotically-inducible protein OsmY